MVWLVSAQVFPSYSLWIQASGEIDNIASGPGTLYSQKLPPLAGRLTAGQGSSFKPQAAGSATLCTLRLVTGSSILK